MSNGALEYKIGGDSSDLKKAFEEGLRYAGDFVNKAKAALSVRGMFDGVIGEAKAALGGGTLADIFLKALKGATVKEQLQQNFAGLLRGDEAQASAMIGALKRFADESHIASGDVMDAARALVTSGGASAGRAVADLKMLGEVSRATKAPLGELAAVWAHVFDTGVADEMALKGLRGAGVSMQSLADASGMTLDAFLEIGRQGRLTFDDLEKAFQRMTGQGGHLFGQIERYKNSRGALIDEAQERFGKIPGAFFEGILGSNVEGQKKMLREIGDAIQGWVNGARDLGEHFAAAVRVAKQLYDKGDLASTLGLGLQAAFIGAINVLMAGLTAAAEGFGSAIEQSFVEAKDLLTPWKANNPGAGGRIGGAFVAGLKDGFNQNAPQLPNGAADQFAAIMAHGMFWSKGLGSTLQDAFNAGIPKNLRDSMGESALGGKNAPGFRAISGNFTAPDALAKVGLYVGAGGPQGERYAQDTAKNTGDAAKTLKGIHRDMKKKGAAVL